MGDFYQNGVVTTLHNLRNRPYSDLERKLLKFSKDRPMALILPCLYSELKGPALPKILDELEKVPYLNEIIIGLDQANEDEFKKTKKFFSRLPQHHRILWNDGPRLRKLDKLLKDKEIAPNEMGKGRNAWYCFGYFNATGKSEAVALHDCDIITYSKHLLARLFYPVVDPIFNYKYCKGYYYRADETELRGRVTRLLVTPLIRTLKKFFGSDLFLEYIDSFRYPLAGEFSMRADVTKTIRIPSDWGLEIGILAEILRTNAVGRICQVDIADRYDHKHQKLSAENPQAGLSKMSIDIAKTIYGKLATNKAVFSKGRFRSIKATYNRIALDMLEQYYSDAVINGMSLDRHKEEEIIDLFSKNVYIAGELFLDNPMLTPSIPSWKRVVSAIPDYYEKLKDAVELDNK
jgi:glucosyl-3-phosphoglycerate synthase